jgi:HD superfamily phosphohydrolase
MMRYLIISTLLLANSIAYSDVVLETVWNKECRISNPLLEKLIESNVLNRLKSIDQSGPLLYFNKAPKFSRYEHSVGVMILLQKAGASLKEQVAGLLHDTSHTAFSHLGDHLLYEVNRDKSYQDVIHLEFLEKMKINDLVSSHNIKIKDLDPDIYSALEQPLPNLCADRIQYIVHTGVVFNKISKEDARNIIEDLNYQNGQWYFHSPEMAKKFGEMSLYFTKELWGAPWNFAFYEYFASALKHALKINIISIEDIKYGKDLDVINSMKNNGDYYIKNIFKTLENIDKNFLITSYDQSDLKTKPKFRGVDPKIKIDNNFISLTQIDKNYKTKFEELKKWCENGYGVKLLYDYKN